MCPSFRYLRGCERPPTRAELEVARAAARVAEHNTAVAASKLKELQAHLKGVETTAAARIEALEARQKGTEQAAAATIQALEARLKGAEDAATLRVAAARELTEAAKMLAEAAEGRVAEERTRGDRLGREEEARGGRRLQEETARWETRLQEGTDRGDRRLREEMDRGDRRLQEENLPLGEEARGGAGEGRNAVSGEGDEHAEHGCVVLKRYPRSTLYSSMEDGTVAGHRTNQED
jgi:hypothetical protein